MLAARRAQAVRAALGLSGPRFPPASVLVALALVFGLLALAASQPVASYGRPIHARTDVEGYVVLDVSRSMLAAAHPHAQTRFDRAVDYGSRLRVELAEIPLGVASLTDRPLPHLFPTADREIFADVLTEAVGIEKPPPAETGLVRATTFGSLRRLATDNYFTARSSRRAAIVLTDGESRPFEIEALAAELREEAISLFVVRFWGDDERVWEPDGTPESYRPDPSAGALLARLGTDLGAPIIDEHEQASLVASVRRWLGEGPVVESGTDPRAIAPSPWIALLAAVPLAFVLVRRPR